MIYSDADCSNTQELIGKILEHQGNERRRLEEKGYTPEGIKRLLDPVTTFMMGMQEDVESYERIRGGDFREVERFHSLGLRLIVLRIYLGVTQGELARRLGIEETRVARDERNDYYGITVERANTIIEALGARLTAEPNPPSPGSPVHVIFLRSGEVLR